MNLKEMAGEWLKEHGYDGLFSPNECSCELSDLMPCGEAYETCEAGYRATCPPECDDHNFHISLEGEKGK